MLTTKKCMGFIKSVLPYLNAIFAFLLLVTGIYFSFFWIQKWTRGLSVSDFSIHGPVVTVYSEKAFREKVLKAKKPVVTHFASRWCGNCRNLDSLFAEVADKLGNNYDFIIVDVDKAGVLAQHYNVDDVPAVLFFNNGKETNIKDRFMEKQPTVKELQEVIEEAFAVGL